MDAMERLNLNVYGQECALQIMDMLYGQINGNATVSVEWLVSKALSYLPAIVDDLPNLGVEVEGVEEDVIKGFNKILSELQSL
jgi:hypothetical protein